MHTVRAEHASSNHANTQVPNNSLREEKWKHFSPKKENAVQSQHLVRINPRCPQERAAFMKSPSWVKTQQIHHPSFMTQTIKCDIFGPFSIFLDRHTPSIAHVLSFDQRAAGTANDNPLDNNNTTLSRHKSNPSPIHSLSSELKTNDEGS